MVPDALGNIVTSLESQKMVGIEDLTVGTYGTGWNWFHEAFLFTTKYHIFITDK
jgi:hypothetical protein